jgi:hypothetical protein
MNRASTITWLQPMLPIDKKPATYKASAVRLEEKVAKLKLK